MKKPKDRKLKDPYACKSMFGKYSRHSYEFKPDPDGNYRCCRRCGKVSFKFAIGESEHS